MSEPRIASIVRYPIKGLPGVPVDGAVAVEPGRGLRWDRSHAIENGRVHVEAPAAWNSRRAYFHVARHEEIVRFGVALDDAESDEPTLSLTSPDGDSATAPLASATDEDSRVNTLLRDTLAGGPAGPVRLIRTGDAGLWDWPAAHLSVINLATVRAVAEAAGAPVDPRRFRGNIMLEGLDAWEELSLVGHRVRMGTAVVEFFQPTDRCRATTIDPTTGVSDLNVPGMLASGFGHMFCGVYARVVSPGSFRAGDALVRVGSAATPLHGERDWPRTACVVAREDAGSRSTSLWIDDPFGRLAAAEPGQHVRVHLADEPAPNWRCYTISGVEDGRVRITVRRDGRISTALRDRLDVGSQLVVTGPFGNVTLDPADERDLVLVSAGSGITPTVAVLHALVGAGATRRVRVLHVERTLDDLALWDEIVAASAELPDARSRLHLTRADSSFTWDSASTISVTTGRPTAEDVVGTLDGLDPASVDVYVCGPALFTADVRTALAGAGVPGDRVHAEVFYSPAIAALTAPRDPSTTGPHRIVAESADVSWRSGSGSILDAVEGAGVDWPSGCRVGACGTCVRRVRRGTVEYLLDPIVPPPEGSVLVCCSAPTSDLELESAP
jgi:ferredoxin-NADP reductase/uncharacterized protein YcbX